MPVRGRKRVLSYPVNPHPDISRIAWSRDELPETVFSNDVVKRNRYPWRIGDILAKHGDANGRSAGADASVQLQRFVRWPGLFVLG